MWTLNNLAIVVNYWLIKYFKLTSNKALIANLIVSSLDATNSAV